VAGNNKTMNTLNIYEDLLQAAYNHTQRALFIYLRDLVHRLPEEEHSQQDLEDKMPERYKQLQEAYFTLDGTSHLLTLTEVVFEYNNNVQSLTKQRIIETINIFLSEIEED
jgi:hypothetical protein